MSHCLLLYCHRIKWNPHLHARKSWFKWTKIHNVQTTFHAFRCREERISMGGKNDPRITKIGRFIRRTRIDELPQIINIIKGEMSIIGPRPERPEFVNEFLKYIPDFNERLAVRPGITGWAQVNGGYELSPKEKLGYDVYYIRHESIKLDFLILLKTIKVIFNGHGFR